MSNNLLFYYFGDDEAYFKTLQGEFRTHTRLNINFLRLYEKDEKLIQALFLKAYRDRPAAIFIDFSKQTQDYLHLARLFKRTHLEHTMVTVGLVDYLSPPEVLAESIATGVNLTHIKSAETYDVVFGVCRLGFPQEISAHGYATASLSDTVEAGMSCKIGYIHPEGLRVETDFHAQKGDRLILNHALSSNKLVPSREVFVRDVTTSNLFYHTKHALDLDFQFIDEFIPPEGMDAADIVQRNKERDEAIRHHKKQLKKWIENNLSRSLEKKAKVLIVDREFHFYQEQPRTDKYSYILRCMPFLLDISEELERLQPKVIAFALEKEDAEKPKNNNEALVKLFQVIKTKFMELQPFVVVFNCPLGSKELQANVGYQNVMSTSSELSVELMLRMADMYEKKIEDKIKQAPIIDKVFLKKTNTDSLAEIITSITILKLSETDMIFTTEYPLPIGANLHLTKPVDMYINVQATKGQSKVPEFHGVIHCLGEVQKKELRRYVNSIFFREHDEKKQAEVEEFKKLNEAKQQEKSEAERKAQEEAQKAAAEKTQEQTQTPVPDSEKIES